MLKRIDWKSFIIGAVALYALSMFAMHKNKRKANPKK